MNDAIRFALLIAGLVAVAYAPAVIVSAGAAGLWMLISGLVAIAISILSEGETP